MFQYLCLITFIVLFFRSQLEGTPNAKYLHTLNLFAYGTFKEYLQNRNELIELTAIMTKKLQHLTVISLAIEKKRIPYSELQDHLHISNVRDLEDLIIEGIYAGTDMIFMRENSEELVKEGICSNVFFKRFQSAKSLPPKHLDS